MAIAAAAAALLVWHEAPSGSGAAAKPPADMAPPAGASAAHGVPRTAPASNPPVASVSPSSLVAARPVESIARWREEAVARYPKLMEALSNESTGQRRIDALLAEMPGAKTLRDKQLLGFVADAEYQRHQQAFKRMFPHLAARFKTEVDPATRAQTLEEEMKSTTDPEAQWVLNVAHSDAVMHQRYGQPFMDLTSYLRTETDARKRIAAIDSMASKVPDAEVASMLKDLLAAERDESLLHSVRP
jgi:hypothetical protein